MSVRSQLPRRPEGWFAPGPAPAGDRGDPDLVPGADEDLSYLAGDFRLFQPKAGHRWSLDDLVTAHVAVEALEGARDFSVVDLGCGLGSVLMLVAWAFPSVTATGIEVQVTRADRARRSLRYNGLETRCAVLDGDLRSIDSFAQLTGKARLVTGTPPYFSAEATKLSQNAEAAACRAEMRGGLEVYLDAGAAVMASEGDLVLCYPDASAQRAQDAARERQLALNSRLIVVPAEGKPPLIVVDRFVRAAAPPRPKEAIRTLVVRNERGEWTDDFRSIRRRFGMPDKAPR